MAGFEHLLKSYDVRDMLDEIASADPPAYLRRCFAEAVSTSTLSPTRVQQLAVCGMVLDAVLNDRDYPELEPDLIGDWRAHYAGDCARIKDTAVAALRRAHDHFPPAESDAAHELQELEHRLAPGA